MNYAKYIQCCNVSVYSYQNCLQFLLQDFTLQIMYLTRNIVLRSLIHKPKLKKSVSDNHDSLKPEIKTKNPVKETIKSKLIKEVREYKAASDAISNQKEILSIIKQQRQKIKKEQLISKVWRTNKIIRLICGLNVLGFGISMIYSHHWLGIWTAGILHPSFLGISGLLIGSNMALLILNNSLCLNLSDQQFKEYQRIDLTSTSWVNILHSGKILIDIGLISYLSNQILLSSSSSEIYGLYGILIGGIIAQSYLILHKDMKNTQRQILKAIMSLCFLSLIYLISTNFQSQDYTEGVKKCQSFLKFKRIQIDQQSINLVLQQ